MKLFNKSLMLICIVTVCSIAHTYQAYDQVYVENNTPYLLAVGLYRTKNHTNLYINKDRTYDLAGPLDELEDETRSVSLKKNELYFLSPLQGIQIYNHPIKLGVDRDLWFSRDIKTFVRSVETGMRANAVHYTNIGSFVKKVYIIENQQGALEAFTSQNKALAASRFSLEDIKAAPNTAQVIAEKLTVETSKKHNQYIRSTPPPSRKQRLAAQQAS